MSKKNYTASKEISDMQKGFQLAERRTKELLRYLAVYPIHIIVAKAYMLGCKDVVEVECEKT